MSLPNPSMNFVASDILTGPQLQDFVENIEALAAGVGFNDGVIDGSTKIADANVTIAKLEDEVTWWEILASTTLGANGDTISLGSRNLPNRKHLKVLIYTKPTGGNNNFLLRFNADTGNNYSFRRSANGAADATTASTSSIGMVNTAAQLDMYGVVEIVNSSLAEKIVQFRSVQSNATPSTAPDRNEGSGKWASNSVIDQIDIVNNSTGDFLAGSYAIVMGHN